MNTPSLNARLLAALLILCAVVAYLPAINAGYIWDDDALLTANPLVHDTHHGLVQIWEGKNSRDYTPLTISTFWLEWHLWGDKPAGYHIVNILLHALAAWLLWRILVALSIPGAWLAALLFAIHPVNVASVAWIAELKNTLSSVFFLASILTFLHAQKENRRSLLVVSVLCFLLAGLAKGAVVTLPLVLFGCILWTSGKITRRDLLRLVPFGVIALVVAWLTIHYQSRAENYGLLPTSLQFRVARASIAVWWYLAGIFFPVHISPIAPPDPINLASPSAWFPAIAIVALLALFLWKRKTWGRPLLFAGGYYLWMLLPVLGFVWMTLQQETPATDWWQYMAAPGIFALVAAAYATAENSATKSARLAMQIALCIVLALLFIQTFQRCRIYKSMETYCVAVLAEDPHAWTLQNNLGILLKQKGELPQAIACYQQSLADNPRFVEARNNLANAFSAAGNFPEAEAQFQEALKLRPENPDLLANLAQVYWNDGKLREAIAAQAGAIHGDRTNPQYYARFGLMLAANKQFPQAVTCFKNALVLDPDNIETQLNLIRGLLATGQRDEAAAICRHALQTAQKSSDVKLTRMIESLLNQATQPAP